MFGPSWEEQIIFNKRLSSKKLLERFWVLEKEEEGVIPRSVREIFRLCREKCSSQEEEENYTIYCSFIQIYNEKIFDLLQDVDSKRPLKIREDQNEGLYVEGLSEYIVQTENDSFALLRRGELNRITRQTKQNMLSSRSHSIF
mmetsp:Transcript_38831/g.37172  ORF Transcript_38831/g.37172 Transcript_38831/m.37172 type:complete len:143 (-) Transcript_38831:5-433(-)